MRKTANPIQVVICAYPQFIGDYNKAAEKKKLMMLWFLSWKYIRNQCFNLDQQSLLSANFMKAFALVLWVCAHKYFNCYISFLSSCTLTLNKKIELIRNI